MGAGKAMSATVGSLFSGIGGFDLGLERAGWAVRWQVESNPFRRQELKRHWPQVELRNDIRTDTDGLERVDLICGGFPCQDLSVAGNRAGLAGERSGLFFQFARVVSELKPRWVLIENVPGLLSSNGGDDIRLVLETLNGLGYTVDIDIADSQHFGVPQRRRRVFLVCEHIDYLLPMKSNSSVQTIGQVITEILLSALAELCEASNIVLHDWDFPKCASEGGRQKRMRLFKLMTEEHWLKFLNDWDATSLSFLTAGRNSASPSTKELLTVLSAATSSKGLNAKVSERLSGDISKSWKTIWAILSGKESWSTISMPTSSTMASPIYGCALAASIICLRTVLLNTCCLSCSDAAISTLTVLRGFIAYARATSSQLFGDLRWNAAWWDFAEDAETVVNYIVSHLGAPCPPEILFESEGSGGDSEAGRKTGKEVAGTLGGSAGGRGWTDDFDRSGAFIPEISSTLGGGDRDHRPLLDGSGAYIINARQDPIVGKQPLDRSGHSLAVAIRTAQTGSNGWGVAEDGQAYTLDEAQGQAVVTPTLRASDPNAPRGPDGKRRDGGPGAGDKVPIVAQTLLGSGGHDGSPDPDRHTLMVGSSPDADGVREAPGLPGRMDGGPDGPRYAALGDAVTVPVAEWIGRRILRAHMKGGTS